MNELPPPPEYGDVLGAGPVPQDAQLPPYAPPQEPMNPVIPIPLHPADGMPLNSMRTTAIASTALVLSKGIITRGLKGLVAYGPARYAMYASIAIGSGVLLGKLATYAAYPIADALPRRWLGWVEDDADLEVGAMNREERIPEFRPRVDGNGEAVAGRGKYVGYLVRAAKLEFGTLQPTTANKLMVRKFLRDTAVKHGLRPTHALAAVERAHALFFVPCELEILTAQFAQSAPVADRHFRYDNAGRNWIQRLWARTVGSRPSTSH